MKFSWSPNLEHQGKLANPASLKSFEVVSNLQFVIDRVFWILDGHETMKWLCIYAIERVLTFALGHQPSMLSFWS